ncbi:MAG: protein-tyrosine-phosphatase [Pseudomonadota bacterium]
MKRLLILVLALIGTTTTHAAPAFNPRLANYIETSRAEFELIPAERQRELKKIALYARTQLGTSGAVNLTFICTHNSRRSHMSQLWAQTAASYFGIVGVSTYSGGTEATAFNPRAVAAISRAGFDVEQQSEGANPLYAVSAGPNLPAMTAFSKRYQDPANPQENFCAVMTCSEADKNCPTVDGASFRVAIPYEDPKAFDGTPLEAVKYDERCRQISREMLWLFSQIGA